MQSPDAFRRSQSDATDSDFAACADPRSYALFQAPSPPLDRRMSVPSGKTSIALKGLLLQIAIHDPSTKQSSGEVTPLEAFAIALFGKMERAKGIEPSYAAWEAAVLPLNYARAFP